MRGQGRPSAPLPSRVTRDTNEGVIDRMGYTRGFSPSRAFTGVLLDQSEGWIERQK